MAGVRLRVNQRRGGELAGRSHPRKLRTDALGKSSVAIEKSGPNGGALPPPRQRLAQYLGYAFEGENKEAILQHNDQSARASNERPP